MSNKDIPTIEVDIDPVVQSVETFEKLGVSEASFNAFRQNVNTRVQANTDAIVTAETAVEELTDQIADRYTKAETDGLLAEKVDLADSLTIKNEVVNGDFSQGTEGWGTLGTTIEGESGRLAILPNLQYGGARQGVALLADNKYYLSATLDSPRGSYIAAIGIGASTVIKKTDGVERLSSVFLSETENVVQIAINSALASDWVKFYADNVSLINLTDTFGAGNEPTEEEMDKLIDLLGGWFDGEITVSQKTLASWLLNDIRLKANKQQEDWITPTLLNGWVAINANSEPQYMIDDFGFVHMRGAVKDGVVGQPIFIVATGYRSPKILSLPVSANSAFGRIYSDATGNIILANGINANVYLSSVTYKAV